MRTEPDQVSAGRSGLIRWVPLIVVGAFVLVFWSVFLGQAERSVFGRVPILDEVYYLDRAAEIASGEIDSTAPHFMSPLYPYLIAGVGAGQGVPDHRLVAAADLRGLRFFQMGCWLGTLLLIRLLAGQLLPEQWQGRWRSLALWLPVVLFALYQPAAVYAMAVLLAAPLYFLVTLVIYLMVKITKGGGRWWILLLGLVLGLAGLLRGTVILLLPVVLVALFWRRGTWRTKGINTLILWAGLAVVLVPPVIHNSRLAGQLVGPSLNGGVNLYIGNGPEANGFYVAAVPGGWRLDPAGRAFLAERFHRPAVSLAEADKIWAAEAWHHMKSDPARVMRLMAYKVWLHLQGWEIDQLTPLAGWTAQASALRILVTPYALLVALGLVGLIGAGNSRLVWLVGAALALLILGQSLFFVVSRYRMILVPMWAVLAGLGAVRLAKGQRLGLGVLLVGVLLTVPWGLAGVRSSWGALAKANEAVRWADVGLAEDSPEALRRAESLYRQALAGEGTREVSWLGLAAVLDDLAEPAARDAALLEGIGEVESPFNLRKVLLGHYLASGQLDAALTLAGVILADHPRDADTLHNASVLLARSGQGAAALDKAQDLMIAHPDDPRGYVDAGILLARSGRREGAREVFRRGLEACPDDSDLVQNLALVSQP